MFASNFPIMSKHARRHVLFMYSILLKDGSIEVLYGKTLIFSIFRNVQIRLSPLLSFLDSKPLDGM